MNGFSGDLAEESGVVDQHLNAAERLLGCFHQRRHPLGVANIANPANRLAAGIANRLHHRVSPIEVAYAHPCALRC